jgi:ABC-type glycerol-3-phosphate transport system permease component
MARLKVILKYVAALGATALFVFPLAWMFLTSVKPRVDVFAKPPVFIFTPTFDNYSRVLDSEFMLQLLNSAIIAGISTAFSLTLGALAAYGFSRYGRFKRADNLLFWILSLRMLPPIAVVVPFYILLRWAHLFDTRFALIMIYSIFNISFAVWLLKGFFDEIPPQLEESAMLEGHSPPVVFLRVALPMVRAGLATTAAFCLIQSLNEFLLALLLTDVDAVTAPVGLANFQRYFGLEWGQFAAAATIFVVPIILFTVLVRHHLVRGMSFGRMG